MADDKQFDPSSAAPAPPEGFDPGSAVPASSTARRVIGDTALSLAKGVIGAGEAAVGIADIPTLGLAGKALSSVGYDPKATHAAIDEYLTPEQLAANRNVREAKGFMPTVGAALRNPSTIVQGAVESVPSIFMGGALARGVRAATGMGPIAAGALGEGAVSAGLTAEGVRQESPEGTLTPTQAGLAVASGAATAGLTALGGAIAKRLGIVDVETALAGQTGAGGSKAMARRIAEGFFAEGVLEELPQSAQEQVVQNIALGKPWHDGVEEAAATGMLSGGLIGGAVNVVDRKAPTPGAPEPVIAGLLPAPGQTVIPMPPGGGGPNLEAEAADINAGAIYGARDAYEAEQAALRAEAAAKPAPLALPAPGTPLGNMVLPNDGGPFSVTQQHIANDAQDHANSVEAAREAEIVRLESSGPIGRAAAASMRTGAAQMVGAQRNEEAQEPKAPLALPEPAGAGEKRAQQRITEIATSLPSGPLGEVQRAAVELSARGGVPLTVIPHPAGQGYTLVPTSILPEAWHGRFAGIQRDGALPQPKPPASQFAGSPSGDVSQQPVPEGMRAAVADWRRDMGTPTPKGAEPTGAPPEPTPPQLPIKKRKAAVSKAEKLTAETGREHEVVPHPFMRGAFAVRPVANVLQSPRSADTSQQQNVYTNQENLDASSERVQEVDTFTDRGQAPEVNELDAAEASQPAKEPAKLYHVSPTENRASIERNGLSPANDQTGFGAVFFTDKRPKGVNGFDVWEVDASDISDLAQDDTTDSPDGERWFSSRQVVRPRGIANAGDVAPRSELDDAAHEAATSPQNDLPHPTAAQADAGNYRKGHVKIHGLDVSIENPAGSVRVGESEDGAAWAASMPHHYGYIRRSEGADGDHVDTFIGPNPESTKVFVVDQIDPKTGKFDEHKVMLGFDTRQQAEAAYRSAYPKGWRGMGAVSATDADGLKSWLKDGDTKRAFYSAQAQATKSPAKAKEVAPEPKRPEGAVAPSALTHAPAVDMHIKADMQSAPMAPTKVTANLLAEPSITVRDRFDGRRVPKHLVPVYSKAIGAAIKLGLPEQALDGIKHFYVKRKDLGGEYAIEAESIGISLDILEASYRGSQIWASTTIGNVIHEVGHHISGDPDGTSFVAASPDFVVRVAPNGKSEAVGAVMHEALSEHRSGSELGRFLGYPLDNWGTIESAEDALIVQEEVFAQAWSVYFTNPDLLKSRMPATFNVMRRVADAVRNSTGIAGARRAVRETLRRRIAGVGIADQVKRGDRLAVEEGARDRRPDSWMGAGRGDVAPGREARGERGRDEPVAEVRHAREGADERGAAEGVREDRQRRGSDEVASEDLRGDGRGFTTFFTDATTGGRKPNTGKRFEPVIDISRTDAFSREYEKHRGNFDDHIATSIPGFRETQQAVGNAIAKSLPNGGTVLDIGASEGSFIKAITALSGGKIKTVGLDPNVAMAKFFLEHSSVPGSTYEMAAFGARADEGAHVWDEPDGTPVHFFKPKEKFDVVHEAMTFQFISNTREGQVARVKELMKSGGIALFEQKFIPEHDEFVRNEAKKDSYKALYYSAAELDRKKKDVLERGEAAVAKEEKDKEEKVVGMHDLMVSPEKFEKILGDNFAHVVQYWDSGNFKGYAASDNPLALSRLVANIGDLNSEYSTVETPSVVKGASRPKVLEIKDDAVPERSFDIGAQRGERDLGAARLTKEDHDKIVADGKALSLPPKRVQEFLAEARKTRSRFPPSRGWAPLELVGVRRIDRPTNDGTMAQDVELFWKPIAYGFNVPPGAKRAPVKIDRAWVDKVADKGVGEILSLYERAKTGDPVAKNIVAHASWYRAMAARLREEFGAAGDFFADLLGAFSPNTPVTTNWNFAVDALRAFSHGEYRQQLEAFDNWIQAGNSPSKFPASDKIRQLSGKLFGINSTNGAMAMLEMWRNIAPGMAPKARNFSANLIGASNEATIDVWAARFLRRMAGTIRGYSAPRIPVVAENAVTGNWNAGTTRVTGEFGFGQDVMAEMSRRLAKRGIDLTPPDLQAVAWFVEKELWTKNAWTSKQGEGGSFEQEADKWQLRRYFSGLSIQRDAAPEDMAMNVAAARLLSTTNADHRVVAHRALPTLGMYYGSEERSFDDEVVAREGWDPGYWIGEVAAIAKESKQQDAMVTRVVGENEVSTNARPGIEVFFKGPITKMQLESIHKAITEGGEAGFTLTIDPRAARTNAGETPDAFNGLRILYVPEFGLRFGDEGIIAAVRAGTDEAISSIMEEKAKAIDDLALALAKRADVAAVRAGRYDSIVFGKENYDEYTGSGVAQEASGERGERVWFGQPLREVLARAARRYGIIEGQDGGADVLQRTADGSGQEEVARRPGSLGVEQGVVERLDEPLWYSRLAKAIDEKAPWSKAGDMPIGQLRMWIAARTKDGTLPAEEVKWSGLDDYLMGIVVSGSIEDGHNGRVKRADVESFLRQNGVKVEEKMLGERPLPPGVKQITLPTGRVKMEGNGAEAIGKDAVDASILLAARFQRLAQHWQKNGDEEQARRYFIRSDAMVEWSESAEGYGTGEETKFSTYQLPGGKNYKELLLTLPQDMSGFDVKQTSDGKWRAVSPGGSAYFGDTREQALQRAGANVSAAKFRSSHFDQPNILAHVRFNERTAADGSRVLFLEEIQSDWAQKGRREGFATTTAGWTAEKTKYGWTVKDASGKVHDRELSAANEAEAIAKSAKASGVGSIPSAPFVGKTEAWVALALKRMIRYAADNGFDAIAWTNGEQQVDRYDLSEQVREVHWGKGGGWYSLTIKTRSGSMEDIGQSISAEKLQDYVGKDVAQKIVDSTSKSGALYGLDIKVGGEGMRAFYDKIVPNVANNLLKKLGGGRVESVKINVGGPGARVRETSDGRFAVLRGEDNDVERFAVLSTELEARKVAAGLSASPQPGFYLTPDMAPAARRPQALFAKSDVDARDVTETPEFKAWFGDSKVVDSDGRPLVVYHGAKGEWESFDLAKSSYGAIWVTPDRSLAGLFTKNHGDGPLALYASIKHPMIVPGRRIVDDWGHNDGAKQKFIDRAKSRGHDGVRFTNVPEGFGVADQWVAFSPEQIKSAIGNSGAFDPKRPSILESRGDLLERAQNLVADTLTTQKSFNLWDRTVGTAFHKAWKDADFKPVYDGVQNYLNDASRMMTEAADLAPDVLPKLEGLRGILGATASKADIESMSSAIFDGTLDDRVYTNAELSQRGLSAKAVELYRQTRAAIDKSLTDLFTSEAVKQAKGLLPPDVLARARDAGDPWLIVDGLSSIPTAQRTPAHQQVYDQLRERLFKIEDLKRQGYAPLMRFGQYTVHLVDQNGGSLSFTMHESEREANAVARAMREAYPQATVSQGVLSQDAWQLFQGVTPDTLEIFAQSLGASDKEIFQKYLHLATNNRSTLKRLIRRKKIPGFSPDAQRALAQFVTSNGRAASRNYHWGDVLKAASAIPKAKGDVKDEAVRLAQYVQHPTEEAGALRGLLFVQFLGGSVASALTNATQPILMSFPYLSRFGAGKAASELVRAAKVAVGGTAPEIDLRDAMNKATHEGIIAPHEVAGLYAESIRNMGSNLVARRILRAWGSLFSLAEAFNRRITFVAAFRLARDAGEADPYGFAVNAIAETQGVYNRGNRPNWARGPVGATLMTFKQYSVAYVEFLARLPAKQRAIALATLVLAAGLQGLPGADDLEDVVDTIAESLGYSFNSKKAAREWAIRTLGESAGGVLAGGFSGLPGVPIDVQARLGLGNLIPGTGVFKRSSPDKSRDVLEFFGPAGSQARSVVDAVSAAQEGNPGAVAKSMLPLAVQNALKAVDMASTGFYHDMRGRRVIDVEAYDAAIKGIGIQPKRVADVQRRRMDLQQDISLQRDVESEIADLWARGVYERDPEKVAQARAKLLDWNLSNPESRVVITPQQIHKRVQQATLTADQRFLKTAPPELRARVASELLQ